MTTEVLKACTRYNGNIKETGLNVCLEMLDKNSQRKKINGKEIFLSLGRMRGHSGQMEWHLPKSRSMKMPA